ncbi:MAG TPA: glycerophosphodiester phosphodiesterase family protein [Trichocoleus sp.]
MRPTLVTAHRGSSGSAPENTLVALRQAITDEADMAEVDVQATADGELVLFHDQDLVRTTGDARTLWQVSYSDLASLDAGRWFGTQFGGEPIPRLRDAMLQVSGRLQLNLELKSYNPSQSFRNRLAHLVIEQVRACEFEAACILTSFDHELLWQLRQQAPAFTLGLIQAAPPETIEDWVDVYSLWANCATPELVRQLQAQQKSVHLWTVNDPEQMQRLLSWGVDSLITNYPRRLRQIVAAAGR